MPEQNITLVNITELPTGTATLANPIMFGIGELLHTTTLEDIKTLMFTGVITEIPPNKIKIVNVFPDANFPENWEIDQLFAVSQAINYTLSTFYGGEITTEPNERIVFRLIQSSYFEPSPGVLIPNVLWRYYSETSGALSFTGISDPSGDIIPNGVIRNEPDDLIDLGDIGVATIESGFNTDPFAPFTMSGNSFVLATQNGEPKIWKWVGGDGLYGGVGTPSVSQDFLLLSQAPTDPLDYLPTKTITTTPYTVTFEDLNRPLIFTSNDQVVNIGTTLAELATNAGLTLFDFKAHFTGTGTHTINYPDIETWTGEQGALIYALCIDTSGDTLWVVKQFEGGGGDESKWEITTVQAGLRLPTETELNAERLSWGSNNAAGAFGSPLKFTMAGYRLKDTGALGAVGAFGAYWTSTTSTGGNRRYLYIVEADIIFANSHSSNGQSVRLIVDGTFTLSQFQTDYENKTFEFQGLTYGFTYNPTTERIWLDRNMGADRVASSVTDSDSYGDLYQWGRSPEGHQVRTSDLYDGALGRPTTATQSGDWDGKFITTTASTWTSTSITDLWQGLQGFIDSFGEIEKLTGKNGLKASYLDLLDKLPLRPDPTDNNRPEWNNGTEFKSLAYRDEIIPSLETGTVISFANPEIYNSSATPATGNITNDLTGALQGVVQKIYHNHTSAPPVPAGWVLMGAGTYTTSELNIIYAEFAGGTRVEYWIVQEQ